MFFGYIFGRLTAYIKDSSLLDDETEGKFRPCPGEDFDLIMYKDGDKNEAQTIIHEEIHAVLDRLGFGQTKLPDDMEEQICQAVSVFIDETYRPKRKQKL
jgi:hypothetical protein